MIESLGDMLMVIEVQKGINKEGEALVMANLALESRTESINSLVKNRGGMLKQVGGCLSQGDSLPRELGNPKSQLETRIIKLKRVVQLRLGVSDVWRWGTTNQIALRSQCATNAKKKRSYGG
jgi:hypothetical protein